MASRVATTSTDHEELVYAPAIVILANDLYPRKLEIVREYIQNASDAIDSFRTVADRIDDTTDPLIKISVHGKSLLIYDTGIGMDGAEIQKLKRIAYSEKRDGVDAGHKGIGRLAGIAVANKLLISSTSYGDPHLHKFEFRAKDLRDELVVNKRKGITEPATQVINRHTTITTLEVDPADHYTMVELRDIDDKHPEILDLATLREFLADMAPVGFAPNFAYGERIAAELYRRLPDYSPKTIWLSTASGDRSQVYKQYDDEMLLAEPEFIEIADPTTGRLLGFCWCTVKGKEMLGRMRPAGHRFSVPGTTPEQRKRLAGLVYKLFGFSIGDRNLPLRTLWEKEYTRALWFTGEIHIVDKDVRPTTDRSDFVDNESRTRFYEAAARQVAKRLNSRAQEISDVRKAHDVAVAHETRFTDLTTQLDNGGIERAELKLRKDELHQAVEELRKRRSKDPDVEHFVKNVTQAGRALERRLAEAKKEDNRSEDISDLAAELHMTTTARKVYTIIMAAIESYFGKDRDGFFELSSAITKALRKRY